MAIANVSTYGSLQTLLQNMAQSQNVLNNDEVEISSGEVSQTFDGLSSGSVEQLTSLNSQLSSQSNYLNNITTYLGQLNTTNTVLGQIQTLATGVITLIAQQQSPTAGDSTSFSSELQKDLDTLGGLLNTSYGSVSLFGGTQTESPPVKSPIPAPATYGTPDTNYYQGSYQTTTTAVAEGVTINNSITAANPAFQDIIAGIQQAINVAGNANNTTDLQHAETLVTNGKNATIDLAATVNSNIVNVQTIQTQTTQLQTYYKGVTQSMTASNVVSLSAQVAQDQSVLQATYETYARISSLTIANYLPNA